MFQTPQKHLEKKKFQVILTTKIHFFYFEKFSDFARLSEPGRKKVNPLPLRVRKKFSRHSAPMMWVFET